MAKKTVRLSHKISALILLAALISLVAALAAAVFFVRPSLQKEAIAAASSNIKLIALQAQAKIDLIESYASGTADSYDLKAALRQLQEMPLSSQSRERVIRVLDDKKSQMPGTLVVAVQPPNGSAITTAKALSPQEREFFYTDEYRYFTRLDYARKFFHVYKVPYSIDHTWGNEPQDRYAAAFCMNFYVEDQRYTISLFVEINDIIEATASLTQNVMDSYAWLDASHTAFVQEGDGEVLSLAQEQLQNSLIYNYDTFRQKDGYLFLHTMDSSKWMLSTYMSDRTLLDVYGHTFTSSILLLALMVLMMIALILPQINRYMNPLHQLSDTMRQAGSGDLSVVSDVLTNDELGELSSGFNHMIRELNVYVSKLLEKEKSEQQMKYSLLISQIDPHFIYNTMNSINYLARKGRDDDIIAVNSALIHILQDRLRVNGIEVFDTVEQELNVIRQYMIIQQFRFQNHVDIVFDVEPALLTVQVPKNILQPLVENALVHGLTDEEGESVEGAIVIRIYQQREELVLQVLDDGRGLSPQQLQQFLAPTPSAVPEERGRQIGIRNIRQRLFYLYGSHNQFSICNRTSGGACVTIVIPSSPGN